MEQASISIRVMNADMVLHGSHFKFIKRNIVSMKGLRIHSPPPMCLQGTLFFPIFSKTIANLHKDVISQVLKHFIAQLVQQNT